MAAAGAPRVLRARRGGRAESEADLRLLRAGPSRSTAVSPGDDGGVAGVRILRGCAVVAEDRAEDVRGRCVPSAGGGAASGPHANLGVPAYPCEGAGGPVHAGAQALHEGWAGEAWARSEE